MSDAQGAAPQAAGAERQDGSASWVDACLEQVETRLEQVVRCDGASTAAIMAYLSSTRGKRLRPRLAVMWHDVFSLPGEALEPAGVAALIDIAATVELVHLASLLHDDLVDGAAERRGMPTVASRWGSGAAVLAGDYLFASAFGMLVESDQYHALGAMARALRDMSEAEVEQLTSAFSPADGPTAELAYWRCVRGKTGSLFAAACESGAAAGGAGRADTDLARSFGFMLGSAFQVADDLLDYTGDPVRLGKPTGQDLSRGLLTLPAIRLLEQGGALSEELRSALAGKRVTEELVRRVQQAVVGGDAAKYTRDAVRSLLHQAQGCLQDLSREYRGRALQSLTPVLGYLGARDF